jgi:hypothetical protein
MRMITEPILNTQKRLIRRRLKLLQIADDLGNVAKACRLCGIDRSSFYKYKKRYQKEGIKGLGNLPPVHKHHPQTTGSQIINKILAISREQPVLGSVRIFRMLKSQKIAISVPTIQKILNKNGLNKSCERLSSVSF